MSKILKRYILAQFWVSQQLDKKLYVKLPQILLQVKINEVLHIRYGQFSGFQNSTFDLTMLKELRNCDRKLFLCPSQK